MGVERRQGGGRRRGRPPGSKNKPKPPPMVMRDVEPMAAMRSHMLEVLASGDVARTLAGFARHRNRHLSCGLCRPKIQCAARHSPSTSGDGDPSDGGEVAAAA
jgi:hypothetical protein